MAEESCLSSAFSLVAEHPFSHSFAVSLSRYIQCAVCEMLIEFGDALIVAFLVGARFGNRTPESSTGEVLLPSHFQPFGRSRSGALHFSAPRVLKFQFILFSVRFVRPASPRLNRDPYRRSEADIVEGAVVLEVLIGADVMDAGSAGDGVGHWIRTAFVSMPSCSKLFHPRRYESGCTDNEMMLRFHCLRIASAAWR